MSTHTHNIWKTHTIPKIHKHSYHINGVQRALPSSKFKARSSAFSNMTAKHCATAGSGFVLQFFIFFFWNFTFLFWKRHACQMRNIFIFRYTIGFTCICWYIWWEEWFYRRCIDDARAGANAAFVAVLRRCPFRCVETVARPVLPTFVRPNALAFRLRVVRCKYFVLWKNFFFLETKTKQKNFLWIEQKKKQLTC